MIFRVEVASRSDSLDPAGEGVRRQLAEAKIDAGKVTSRRLFFIDTRDSLASVREAAAALLADPIAETSAIYASGDALPTPGGSVIEVHLKPGVMDPVASSAERALRDVGVSAIAVRTARAFSFEKPLDRATLESVAKRYLANSVIEHVFFAPQLPEKFAEARAASFDVRHVPIRELSDDQLKQLSRDGHLFLNLVEMQAVQAYFRELKREPTDAELETIAQTWSEHCVHKTLKSAVEVVDESGAVVRKYGNLIKETIFQSTMDLIRGSKGDFCLSVFKDNAGVIAFDDTDAVCFKVETHNRPSAIEPYGGAATGIGGCIRDVLGTGLGARPIANTNVFCVAYPESGQWAVGSGQNGNASPSLPTAHRPLPTGVIHPKRILQQVVAGVRDYGNRMGIPTVNGAVHFNENYVGNPLVFAGCVGIIPRDKITKAVNRGDAIVVLGGRTGRDGIHGATFSSAELTSTHADEFSHAVQIGNAITQKQLMDVLLVARDRGLYSAVTDCGAGGLSSAIGEMGADVGAMVHLDLVPLKYAGLRYDEIWISEAQERMVLSVPPQHLDALLALAGDENVEATMIGTFGTDADELVLNYHGNEVARMKMSFLHDGIPMPTRKAVIRGKGQGASKNGSSLAPRPSPLSPTSAPRPSPLAPALLAKLADPNVASKHWIIRQYDHEVQGGTVVKPLVGPTQTGPSDAAVIRPKATSRKGVVLANGLVIDADRDPYETAIASIDEAIRNAVCVGADLSRLAILDNFCWPGVHDEVSMGTLVRACEACRDAAIGYGVPFISGKDSLHNQFTDAKTGTVIRIPPTLLISAIGVIDDVSKCVTSDFKHAGSTIVLVRSGNGSTIGANLAVHQFVSTQIASGKVRASHDVSDGGALVAVAEMCIGSGLGATIETIDAPFAEPMASYVLEVDGELAVTAGVEIVRLGTVSKDATLRVGGESVSIDELTRAWRGPLDW